MLRRCPEHDLPGVLLETHLVEDPRTGRPFRVKRLRGCPQCAWTWESREYRPSPEQLRTWAWLKRQPHVRVVITASALGYRPKRPARDEPRPEARVFLELCRRFPAAAAQEAALDLFRPQGRPPKVRRPPCRTASGAPFSLEEARRKAATR